MGDMASHRAEVPAEPHGSGLANEEEQVKQ